MIDRQDTHIIVKWGCGTLVAWLFMHCVMYCLNTFHYSIFFSPILVYWRGVISVPNATVHVVTCVYVVPLFAVNSATFAKKTDYKSTFY